MKSSVILSKQFLLLGYSLILASVNVTSLVAQPKPPAQFEPDPMLLKLYEPREYADRDGNVLPYRLMKPIDYDHGNKYPIVVFLHGAGERGNDNVAQLKHAATDFANEDRRKKFPAYFLLPQCATDRRWVETDWKLDSHEFPEQPSVPLRMVKELLDMMIEDAGIDTTRIYITGLSMGGFGTWDALARYEDFFAAGIPVCGGADLATAPKISRVPIWAFHGAKDTVVKPARTRSMIDALVAEGSRARFTEYPDAAHDSWTATYKNSEIYDWLFAQQKE